jgi:hypothetical protein
VLDTFGLGQGVNKGCRGVPRRVGYISIGQYARRLKEEESSILPP